MTAVEYIVPELHIVNDNAEHRVALMQESNALLTKDDDHTQFAIQIIKCYPDFKKETSVKGRGPVGSPK